MMGCLLLMGSVTSLCRAQDLDSLKVGLQFARADTHKVWMLRDIAYWSQAEPDSAIYYSQKGADLAASLDFQSGRIWNLYQQCIALETRGEFEAALDVYEEMFRLARESGDHLSIAKLFNALGSTYYYAGDFVKAVEYYERGYRVADSLGYAAGLGYALNNMAVIYRLQGRYKKAIEVYKKSLQGKTNAKDTAGMVNSLYNLGLAYSYAGAYDSGIDYFRQAREIALALDGRHADLAIIDIGVGTALFQKGEWEEAGNYLRSGIEEAPKGSQEWLEGWALLGAIEVEEGKVDAGLQKLEEALNATRKAGRQRLLVQILKVRAMATQKVGEYLTALKSWREYQTLSDSLYSEQRQWAQEEMQAKFDLKDKEATIALQELTLKKESARKRLYLISGSFSLLLFFSSVGFVWWVWKQRRRLQNEIILKEGALDRNQLLMSEMHHRTKNNLQLLNSLLSLRSRGSQDRGAREALESSRETVNAIGLLHHHLYKSSQFRNVSLRPFIGDLADNIQSAANLEERGVRLETFCDEVELDIDEAIPVGLVINELVTNAIQHAFPEGKTGRVSIIVQFEAPELVIEVEDNGLGMDQSKSGGSGTRLIQMLVARLGGELQNQTPEGGGTRVRFSFIIKKERHGGS